MELNKIYCMDCLEDMKQLDRDFIGFEISQEYVYIVNKRLANVQKGFFNKEGFF